MIASSSTFRPHPTRAIRDLFCLLHAVRHDTESLVYRNHPREAAASSYLAIIYPIGLPVASFDKNNLKRTKQSLILF